MFEVFYFLICYNNEESKLSPFLPLTTSNVYSEMDVTEEFEDTKGVIRIRKSKKDRQHNGQLKKDRQHNGQQKKDKRTNNNLQNIHITDLEICAVC